jgi:hypothetical protein
MFESNLVDCTMKALGSRSRFFGTMAFIMLFYACNPCDHYYEPHDSVANALMANPRCSFIDSSGQQLELYLVNSGLDDFENSGSEGRCQSIETHHYPNFHFQFMPAEEGDLVYSQIYDHLKVKNIHVSYSIGNYDGPNYTYRNGDTTLTIQGHQYANCWASLYKDSTGLRHFIAFDLTYGLVAFQYRDQYRWERVLNP